MINKKLLAVFFGMTLTLAYGSSQPTRDQPLPVSRAIYAVRGSNYHEIDARSISVEGVLVRYRYRTHSDDPSIATLNAAARVDRWTPATADCQNRRRADTRSTQAPEWRPIYDGSLQSMEFEMICKLVSMRTAPAWPSVGSANATAQVVAQALLVGFQASVQSTRAFGQISKNGMACLSNLPEDSFAELVQTALGSTLSGTDLETTDAYFSGPTAVTNPPRFVAWANALFQGSNVLTRNRLKQSPTEDEKGLEAALNKLEPGDFLDVPQAKVAYALKASAILTQCGIVSPNVKARP